MERKMERKLAMYNLVRQLMEENTPTWSSVPAVESVFNDFTAKVAELETLRTKQQGILTGYTASKTKLRSVTIEQAKLIIAALVVYGKTNNDEVLSAKVEKRAASLNRISQDKLLASLEEIEGIATELSAELIPFGVSNAHISEFANNCEALKEQMYRVRMEIVKRKQITQAIAKVGKSIDGVLKSGLDQFIQVLKSVDAKFYEKYKSARRIIEHGAKHKLPPNNSQNPKGFLSA